MSTLGIKINRISQGVQDLRTINPGEWTQHVIDIRNDMRLLQGDALSHGGFVLLLSNISTGNLLTLCRYIPGRGSDLVSAWIYIPANIVISAAEVISILNKVKTELSNPSISDWSPLESLFATNYPTKSLYVAPKQSSNSTPAIRYYGTGCPYNLQELLGDKIQQSYYLEHKFVFLIEKTSGIIAPNLTDLTNQPLREYIPMTPPTLPTGITLKINGRPFNSPVLVCRGENILLTFEKPGFEPLNADTVAGNPVNLPDPLPWKKSITLNHFFIHDNQGNVITNNYTIRVNGRVLSPAGLALPEAECANVNITVSSPDFDDYNNTFNLKSATTPISIELRRKKIEVLYQINGFKTTDQCPKGYQVISENRNGHKLIKECEPATGALNSFQKLLLKKWLIIAYSIVLLLIGCTIGYLVNNQFNKTQEEDIPKIEIQETVSTPAPEDAETEEHSTVVYNCLSDDKWIKADIEKEPNLQGLFDDLLLFKTESLTGKWKNQISAEDNPQWDKLLKAIEQNKDKDFQYKRTETEISVSTYIDQLNKAKSKIKPAAKKEDQPIKKTTTAAPKGGINELINS